MAAKLTKNIYIKVDGRSYDCLEGTTVRFGGWVKTPVAVPGKAGRYYQEAQEPGGATIILPHDNTFEIEAIRAWDNVTVVAETDSGLVYQMAPAFVTNNPELSDSSGGVTIELAGPPFVEV